MTGIPILRLNGETITSLYRDADRDVVLVGLDSGRILLVSALASTAYSAGSRRMYARASDSFGNKSATASSPITYALWKEVLKISSQKARLASKKVSAFSASSAGYASATFVSPIMFAGSDFERWHSLMWEQESGDGEVVVSVRAAKSEEELASAGWKAFRESRSGSFQESLDDICQDGPWMQVRVEMRSSGSSPSAGSVGIRYGTKHATYFFTSKVVLEKESGASSGLLTASATRPQNTEVFFGLAASNTTDWKEYHVIEPDKLFQVPGGSSDRLKVGIKLVSYDASSQPEVDEFAIAFGAEKDNLLNKTRT